MPIRAGSGHRPEGPPPAPQGRRIKLRYMTQVKQRPPGFIAMCSHPDDMPDSYRRYLEHTFREAFKLQGTPLRIQFVTAKNPFADKDKK